jgi:hypothetical protein
MALTSLWRLIGKYCWLQRYLDCRPLRESWRQIPGEKSLLECLALRISWGTMRTKLMLALCILSLAVSALRWVPALGLSDTFADFALGLGVGSAFGLVVIWVGERGQD